MQIKEKKVLTIFGLILLNFLFVGMWLFISSYLKESYWFLIYENKPFIIFLTVLVLIVILLAELFIDYKILISINNMNHKKGLEIIDKEKQEELDYLRDKFFEGTTEGDYSFQDFIKLFENVASEKPQLSGLMEIAINQMNTFTEDKKRLKTVLKLQRVDYPVITNCIATTENRLLKSMQSLLVDISVFDPAQLHNEDRKESYQEIYQSIENKLKVNKQNLNNFNELVMRARGIKDVDMKEDYEILALIKALNTKLGEQSILKEIIDEKNENL